MLRNELLIFINVGYLLVLKNQLKVFNMLSSVDNYFLIFKNHLSFLFIDIFKY